MSPLRPHVEVMLGEGDTSGGNDDDPKTGRNEEDPPADSPSDPPIRRPPQRRPMGLPLWQWGRVPRQGENTA